MAASISAREEPQSSTTYRSFVQRYRECERNAGVQWSIDFNPHPRAWHIVSDDIIYAGSEMNVDTDEFLKSLKSLQVSPCECSAKNPDSDYPTSTRKPAPDSRRCTAGARPRPARTSRTSPAVHNTSGPSPATPSIKYTGSITATACTPISTSYRNATVNLKEKLAVYNELDVAWFEGVKCTCAANVGVIGDSVLPTRRRYRTRDRTR